MEQADSELRVPGLPPSPLLTPTACPNAQLATREGFHHLSNLQPPFIWSSPDLGFLKIINTRTSGDVSSNDTCCVCLFLSCFHWPGFWILHSAALLICVNLSDLPICAENLIMNGFFWKIFWNCFDPLWLQVWIVFGLLATILLNGFQLAIGLNKTLKSVMLVNNPENCIWRARLHKKREKKDNLLLPWN